MRSRQAPATATWLLERFHCGSRSDSLTGDLIEEYQRGRSRVWYWKQVVIAIVVSFCTGIRAHSLLTLRAMATGWAVWYSYASLKSWLFSQAFFQTLAYKLPLAFGHAPGGLVWWIARLSVWAGSGWLVARLHRDHATTMVLAFTASVFLWKLQILPWTCHLVVDAIGDPRYRLELLTEMMGIILPPLCILLGGLFGAGAQGQPNPEAAT
jgi:hypothetical protein